VVTLAMLALYVLSNAVHIDHGQNYSKDIADRYATTSAPPATAQSSGGTHRVITDIGAKGAEVRISESRRATYRGVSFDYSASLASEIKAETIPAYALNYETDKPDNAVPEHIVFKFAGSYASRHTSSSFSPRIAIYPIEGYKKALAKSQSYVQQFEADIQRLKRILSQKAGAWDGEIPLLPFGSASQEFHARVKYLNFQNGSGVMFLTQYNIEPALINNQGLTYAFQGITDDGTYYVSATFPVTVPFLPENYSTMNTEDYNLIPPKSYQGYEYESYQKSYKSYLDKVINKLESLPSENYQPDLVILENLIHSLDVK
jgi:hypothetical protein